MHEEREAPCGLAQAGLRCQPNISCRAWLQETPVARSDLAATAWVSQLCAEAPIGAVESPDFGAVPEPVEVEPESDEDEPPQPASSAAARTAIARGVVGLIGSPPNLSALARLSPMLGRLQMAARGAVGLRHDVLALDVHRPQVVEVGDAEGRGLAQPRQQMHHLHPDSTATSKSGYPRR